MRLITLDSKDLKKYSVDPEMLQKAKRPCALIIHLKYKGHRYDFAVPLRSNISPSTPKSQYFPLPPRKTTKPKHRHGVHYIKMFPVKRNILKYYRTTGNAEASLIKTILTQHEKQIIQECQKYLIDYEKGIRSPYSTNIDKLINVL